MSLESDAVLPVGFAASPNQHFPILRNINYIAVTFVHLRPGNVVQLSHYWLPLALDMEDLG